jgi:hypothetical protein
MFFSWKRKKLLSEWFGVGKNEFLDTCEDCTLNNPADELLRLILNLIPLNEIVQQAEETKGPSLTTC